MQTYKDTRVAVRMSRNVNKYKDLTGTIIMLFSSWFTGCDFYRFQ